MQPCVVNVTRVFFCTCHSYFRSYYITKASRTFLGGYQGQMLLFPRRNRSKSWRSFMLFRCPSRKKIIHVIWNLWRSVSQGLGFRIILLASLLLHIFSWKCSGTFVLRWESNVAAIWRFWFHSGHLGRLWLCLMFWMAHQIMERFIRLGIGTFSYCVGANGPRLFIFSGASP